MHEFAFTENLLHIALQKADSKRIVRVNLLIGPFSQEREDSIHSYWKDLAKGSPGEDAVICFEHAKVSMKCMDCSGTLYLDANSTDSVCRYCYSDHLQVLHDSDIEIKSIEVE